MKIDFLTNQYVLYAVGTIAFKFNRIFNRT